MKQSILTRWAKSEEEIPVHEETICLIINGVNKDFHLIHNFNMFHLDIYMAVDEWIKVTRDPTIDDFCHFVNFEVDGEIKLVCIPKDKWIEFDIEQKLNRK